MRDLVVRIRSDRPHDPRAFTQGLELHGGRLYESTGGFGSSTLRRVDPRTGELEASVSLPADLFGEGLAVVGDRLIQLTWRAGQAIVWDPEEMREVGRLSYEGEGWGLCFDGRRLVMSDGSDTLTFRDSETFEVLGQVRVSLAGRSLTALNELECVDGAVWANVWQTDEIVRIDPFSGRVLAVVDASALLPTHERQRADVLNGIAWDAEAGTFLLTGKLWPRLFEVFFRRSVRRFRGAGGSSADLGPDLEHPTPGLTEVVRQVQGGEDVSHLVTAYVLPDVVPLGVAQQMGHDPGTFLRGSLGQDALELGPGHLVVGKEVEKLRFLSGLPATVRIAELAHRWQYTPAREECNGPLTLGVRWARFFPARGPSGGHNSAGRVQASQA